MKNLSRILLVITALAVCLPVVAQKKRVSSPAKASTSSASGKYGVVLLPFEAEYFADDASALYVMASRYDDSNILVAIDKKTGEVRQALRDRNLDDEEEMRPFVTGMGCTSDSLFLACRDYGIVRWDGKSIESSARVVDYKAVAQAIGGNVRNIVKLTFSPNGRYMAALGEATYVFDREDDGRLVTWTTGIDRAVVDDSGQLIAADSKAVYFLPNQKGSFIKDSFRRRLDNAASRTFEQKNGDFDQHKRGEIVFLAVDKDSVLHMAMGRRLFKMRTDGSTWETEAKLNIAPNTTLERFVSNLHNAWAQHSGEEDHFVEWAKDDLGGTPTAYGQLVTDVPDVMNYDKTKPFKSYNVSYPYMDREGNLWAFTNCYRVDVVVLNSGGIVGYNALKGKFLDRRK